MAKTRLLIPCCASCGRRVNITSCRLLFAQIYAAVKGKTFGKLRGIKLTKTFDYSNFGPLRILHCSEVGALTLCSMFQCTAVYIDIT